MTVERLPGQRRRGVPAAARRVPEALHQELDPLLCGRPGPVACARGPRPGEHVDLAGLHEQALHGLTGRLEVGTELAEETTALTVHTALRPQRQQLVAQMRADLVRGQDEGRLAGGEEGRGWLEPQHHPNLLGGDDFVHGLRAATA